MLWVDFVSHLGQLGIFNVWFKIFLEVKSFLMCLSKQHMDLAIYFRIHCYFITLGWC